MVNLAAVVRGGGAGAAALVQPTARALEFWLATDPRSLNWWWNELSVPGLQNLGGRNGFPPPENNELVLSNAIGCTDTVPFPREPKNKHPVLTLGQSRTLRTHFLPPHYAVSPGTSGKSAYVISHAPEMPDFWHGSLYARLMADR